MCTWSLGCCHGCTQMSEKGMRGIIQKTSRFSCGWSRKLFTKSFHQVWVWCGSLPWFSHGNKQENLKKKKKTLKNIMFSHLTVNCSLLRCIKGQLDFFSRITACFWLEWWLLLFLCPASESIHFKAYVLSPSRKVFIFFSPGVCVLPCLGPVVRQPVKTPRTVVFTDSLAFSFFFPLLCIFRFLCEAAATAPSCCKTSGFSFVHMWTGSILLLRSQLLFQNVCFFV